jgi:hypothetical protein
MELIKDLIPEKFFKLAANATLNNENLNERFALLNKGFEEFNLQQYFCGYKYDFENTLQDLIACIHCNGVCKTSVYVSKGIPIFQELDYESMKFYRSNHPIFKVSFCPGVAERKAQIKEQLTTKKTGSEASFNQNTGEKYTEFKEKLLKPSVVSLDKKRQEREWLP